MLQDLAQHAAMAALLCGTAGWPYLATLCSALSKQAAAGGRAELLPLLQVRASQLIAATCYCASAATLTVQFKAQSHLRNRCTAGLAVIVAHICDQEALASVEKVLLFMPPCHCGYDLGTDVQFIYTPAALQRTPRATSATLPRPVNDMRMQVEGLDACRARALHQAGLKAPAAVLAADEATVKEALASALPRGMRRRTGKGVVKGGTIEAAQVLVTIE